MPNRAAWRTSARVSPRDPSSRRQIDWCHGEAGRRVGRRERGVLAVSGTALADRGEIDRANAIQHVPVVGFRDAEGARDLCASDLSAIALNGPIQSSIPTPTGKGYFMVGSDGGVFAFGDAVFRGSMGNVKLNQPVQSLVPTRTNQGYWLVASDGGIFAFGDAAFHGSTGAMTLNKPIVNMASTPSGQGYWLIASDGGIFAFGDAPFRGSTGAITLNKPIISGAAIR